jgi:hypothetical protein
MEEHWDYDPRKRQWYSNQGGAISDEQLRKLPVDEQVRITGMSAPSFTATPRQSGRTSASSLMEDNQPLFDPIRIDLVPSGTVIRFLTHSRFTYAAVFVPAGKMSDPCWYITGSGKWFGTNVLTTEQMSEVLMRESTSHIKVMQAAPMSAAQLLT